MTSVNVLNDPRLEGAQDSKLDLMKVLDLAKRSVVRSDPLADPRDGQFSDIVSFDAVFDRE